MKIVNDIPQNTISLKHGLAGSDINKSNVAKESFLLQNKFILIGELGDLLSKGLPKWDELSSCGIYSISVPENYYPEFYNSKEVQIEGNVIKPWSEDRLKNKWVENVDIVYYGLAGARSIRYLYNRLTDLLNHGNGKTTDRGPHKGGEILWQLRGYEKFKVWVLPTAGPPVPRIIEENLLKRFYTLTGKLPFANRQF